MNATQLIQFIKQHGFDAYTNADGSLTCNMWVKRPDQSWFIESTIVPASISAVRNWLGY